MKYRRTHIPDVIVFEPQVFTDERGFFLESFRDTWLQDLGIHSQFVQDNHSRSEYGVLRGLHLQKNHPQGKLVRVISGKIYNVAVDMRLQSPTYGQWVGEYLSADNFCLLWVPPGFANGFVTLSKSAEILYKCDQYYDKTSELSLCWNDPVIGIQWPMPEGIQLIISDKDKNAAAFVPGQGFYNGIWQEAGKP